MRRSFWGNLFGGPRLRFSLEELQNLYRVLQKNMIVTDENKALVVETIRSVAEFMIWGDQNEPKVFDFFLENNVMLYLNNILLQKANRSGEVAKQVLQTLSIIIQNVRSQSAIFFLFSNNHINNIVNLEFGFEDEEVLGYYVSFLKTISLKLNSSTVQFFFDSKDDVVMFPLYTAAVRFAHHKEEMVRAAVRTMTLNVYNVNDPNIQAYVTSPPANSYFLELALYAQEQIQLLDKRMVAAEGRATRALDLLNSQLAEVEDIMSYYGDVMSVGTPLLAHEVSQHFWNILSGPVLFYPLLELGRVRGSRSSEAPQHTSAPEAPGAASANDTRGAHDTGQGGIGRGAGNVRAKCSLYVLERMFLVIKYKPLLHQALLTLLHKDGCSKPDCSEDDERSVASSSGLLKDSKSYIPRCLSRRTSYGAQEQDSLERQLSQKLIAKALTQAILPGHYPKCCRSVLLDILSGDELPLVIAALRLLIAVLKNEQLAADILAALGLTPYLRVHQSDPERMLSTPAGVNSTTKHLETLSKLSLDGCPIANESVRWLVMYYPNVDIETLDATDGAAHDLKLPYDHAGNNIKSHDLEWRSSATYSVASSSVRNSPRQAPPASASGSSLEAHDNAARHHKTASVQTIDTADGVSSASIVANTAPHEDLAISEYVGRDVVADFRRLASDSRGTDVDALCASGQDPHIFTTLLGLLSKPEVPPSMMSLVGWLAYQLLPRVVDSGASESRSIVGRSQHDGCSSISHSSDLANGFASHQDILNDHRHTSNGSHASRRALHSAKLIRSCLALSQKALLQQLNGMWGDALISLFSAEWATAREAILRPKLHANSSAILYEDISWPVSSTQPSTRRGEAASKDLSRSALAALNLYRAVAQSAVVCQTAQLMEHGEIAASAPIPTVTEAELREMDIHEGCRVDLVSGSALPCVVSFAPGQERKVFFAIAGLSLASILAIEGDATPDINQNSLLRSLPVAVLADPDPDTLHAGVVLSVAPLFGTDPVIDQNVSKWLHIYVRPSVRSLHRILKDYRLRRSGLSNAAKQLADGHWILAFPDAERAISAKTLVHQHEAKLRALYCNVLTPILSLPTLTSTDADIHSEMNDTSLPDPD